MVIKREFISHFAQKDGCLSSLYRPIPTNQILVRSWLSNIKSAMVRQKKSTLISKLVLASTVYHNYLDRVFYMHVDRGLMIIIRLNGSNR